MIAQSAGDGLGAGFVFVWVVIAWVIGGLAFYGIFTKAGKPGWAGFIPIYNTIVMLEVVGRPVWWIFLLFIPFVNLVIWIIVAIDLAKSFGKSTGYAVGMILIPVIFYPMLAFGSAQYQGPAAAPGGGGMPPAPPAPAG